MPVVGFYSVHCLYDIKRIDETLWEDSPNNVIRNRRDVMSCRTKDVVVVGVAGETVA